jgi:hypothetical protein
LMLGVATCIFLKMHQLRLYWTCCIIVAKNEIFVEIDILTLFMVDVHSHQQTQVIVWRIWPSGFVSYLLQTPNCPVHVPSESLLLHISFVSWHSDISPCSVNIISNIS